MRRRAAGPVVALVAAGLLLAGCSGGSDSDQPAADGDASSAPAGSAPGSASDGAAPVLGQAEPALDDLTVKACPSGEGELTASGRVRNRATKKPVDYVVTVSWLDEAGAVLGTGYATVEDVPRKKSRGWTVETTLDQPAASCTTQLSRGELS